MAFTLPLNLEYWFINGLSGSLVIFLAIALVVIAGMAARFRMTNGVLLATLALFAVMFSTYLGGGVVLVILLTGLIGGWVVSRFVR